MEDDDSIQAFTPNRAHQSLDVGSLPGRSRRNELLLDTHAIDSMHEGRTVDRIPVAQQILGCCVVGESIDDLLGGPPCSWCISNVEMNDSAPFMLHDDQHVEKAAGHRRNHKEIHRCNGASMVLEKGPPTL